MVDRLTRISKKQRTLDVSQPVKVAADLLGVSVKTVQRYVKEGPSREDNRGNRTNHTRTLDENALDAMEEYMRDRHSRHEYTPAVKVRQYLMDEGYLEGTISIPTMCKYMTQRGYRWSNKTGRLEHYRTNPAAVARMHAFVRALDEYEAQGYVLVFVDESYCHQYHNKKWGWFKHGDYNLYVNQKGERILINGAGTKDGWIEGSLDVFAAGKKAKKDYHASFDANYYWEWMENKLLPNLPHRKRCVIVMDNASYHIARPEETPKPHKLKKEGLIKAMKELGIAVPKATVAVLKATLREWITANIPPYVETLAEAKGHKVLFTPPHFHEVQPIEMVWASVKGNVAREFTKVPGGGTSFNDMKERAETALAEVTPELWANCVAHSRQAGREYVAEYPLSDKEE